MSEAERLVTSDRMPGEGADRALRPQGFDEFVGQPAAKANLKVFVEAARARGEAMDHVREYWRPSKQGTRPCFVCEALLGFAKDPKRGAPR